MTFGILRLGDAVQRWLRHPEPSSSSVKSTIKEKYLYVSSRETTGLPYELKSKSRQQPKKQLLYPPPVSASMRKSGRKSS